MLNLRRKAFVFGILSAILLVGGASAQTNTSAIAGVITDETGAVVPNATVTSRKRRRARFVPHPRPANTLCLSFPLANTT